MNKTKKLCENLVSVFNIMCIVAPIGMAVIFSFVYVFGGWEWLIPGHNLAFYVLSPVTINIPVILILFFAVLSIYITIYLISKIQQYFSKHKYLAYFLSTLIVFFTAAVIRISLIYVFQKDIQPFSDFQRIWEMANGYFKNHIEYYTLFPTYLNFMVFEQRVISLFGNEFINLLFINGILSSATAVLVYFIAKAVFKNEKLSIAAGLLYAYMPSNIYYCVTGTPEFLVVFFNLLSSLFFIYALKDKSKKRFLYILIGSLSIGIGSSFKSFGVIIMIAVIMALCFQEITENSELVENYSVIQKRIVSFVLAIILAFGGYKMSSSAILYNTEKTLNMELDSSLSLPHYFLIGLNTEGEGQIHLGSMSRLYYKTYLNNGYNASAAKKYATQLLKDDWQNNTKAIMPNLLKKMIWAWQDDYIPLHYFINNVQITPESYSENAIYSFSKKYMASVEQIYYCALMLFAMVGYIAYCKQHKINYTFEFLALIIFGYFCLMILSEAQSRYKCLIMPYICIISAIGIYTFVRTIKAGIDKHEKSADYRG